MKWRRVGVILTVVVPLALYWAIADKLSWRPRTLLKSKTLTVSQVVFSPDGMTLAAAMFNADNSWPSAPANTGSKIELWDVRQEKLLRQMVIRSGKVGSVCFVPDRNVLASLEWHIAGDQLVIDPRLDLRTNYARQKRLLTTHMSIRLWNPQAGQLIQTLARYRKSVFGPENCTLDYAYYLAPWPNKTKLTFFGGRSGMQECDLLTGRWLHPVTTGVNPVALSPDGHTRASGPESDSVDDGVHLWDQRSGRELRILRYGALHLRTGNLHGLKTRALAFSPNGAILASAEEIVTANGYTGELDSEFAIGLWDTSNGHLLRMIRGLRDNVRALAFSPDSSLLASAGEGKLIALWDVSTGTLLRPLEGHRKGVNTIAFSPDGNTLASGSEDGTIKLWRIH